MFWRGGLGAVILIAILTTQQIDGAGLWEGLTRVDPLLLSASCVGFFALMAAKTWRWKMLIREAGLRYSFGAAYRSYLSAFALGIVTPGRLGELARAAQLRTELGAELWPCARSVISDRMFDLLFLAAFGSVALWAVFAERMGDAALLGLFIMMYVGCCVLLHMAGTMLAGWRSLWRPLRWLEHGLGKVADDLAGRSGLVGFGITAMAYFIYFGSSFLLIRALGVDVGFREVSYVTGCLSLVLLLPISIAGIGPREATLIVLLGRYGVGRDDALAYSILQFAVFTLLGGIAGAVSLALHRDG